MIRTDQLNSDVSKGCSRQWAVSMHGLLHRAAEELHWKCCGCPYANTTGMLAWPARCRRTGCTTAPNPTTSHKATFTRRAAKCGEREIRDGEANVFYLLTVAISAVAPVTRGIQQSPSPEDMHADTNVRTIIPPVRQRNCGETSRR